VASSPCGSTACRDGALALRPRPASADPSASVQWRRPTTSFRHGRGALAPSRLLRPRWWWYPAGRHECGRRQGGPSGRSRRRPGRTRGRRRRHRRAGGRGPPSTPRRPRARAGPRRPWSANRAVHVQRLRAHASTCAPVGPQLDREVSRQPPGRCRPGLRGRRASWVRWSEAPSIGACVAASRRPWRDSSRREGYSSATWYSAGVAARPASHRVAPRA